MYALMPYGGSYGVKRYRIEEGAMLEMQRGLLAEVLNQQRNNM
jgi:hypothetical protein